MDIVYKKLEIMCPEGYEDQVMAIALIKVEGIISQLVLSPTTAKKNDFDTKIQEAYTINNFIKK